MATSRLSDMEGGFSSLSHPEYETYALSAGPGRLNPGAFFMRMLASLFMREIQVEIDAAAPQGVPQIAYRVGSITTVGGVWA
jgi:hypothetical protein